MQNNPFVQPNFYSDRSLGNRAKFMITRGCPQKPEPTLIGPLRILFVLNCGQTVFAYFCFTL